MHGSRGRESALVQPSHASGLWTAAERCDPAVECLNIPAGAPLLTASPAVAFLAQSFGSATRSSGTCGPGAGWIINGDAPVTRISAVVSIAAVALACAPTLSSAQNAASPRGAGNAQSSGGASHRRSADGGALGTGRAKPPATPSPDAVVQQENALLERKLKGICRGC
jgi:hypothetical protein